MGINEHESGGPGWQRLKFVKNEAEKLRRLTDKVIGQAEFGDVSREAIAGPTRELQDLVLELKATADVAAGFKQKWDKQRAMMLSSRESEVEAHLRSEALALYEKGEALAKAEIERIEAEYKAEHQRSIEDRWSEHGMLLRHAAQDWTQQYEGGNLVRTHQVAELVKESLKRLAAWTVEEEEHIMRIWEQILSELLKETHKEDNDLFLAMAGMHRSRCQLLNAALGKQHDNLDVRKSELRVELEQELTRAKLNLDGTSTSTEVKKKRNATPKARPESHDVDGVMRKQLLDRIQAIRSKATQASHDHTKDALKQLDEFESAERRYLMLYQETLSKVASDLSYDLECGMLEMTEEAIAASNSRSKGTTREATDTKRTVGTSAASSQASAALSHPPGSQSKTKLRMSLSDKVAKETSSLTPSVPEEPPKIGNIEQLSSDSDDDSLHPQQIAALKAQKETIRALGKELEKAEYDLLFNKESPWRKSLGEVANIVGRKVKLRTGACKVQSAILKDESAFKTYIDNVGRGLVQRAEDDVSHLCSELTKGRNVKVALARARLENLRETSQSHHYAVLDFEEKVLPAVSQLAHEAEVAVEVGKSLQRGNDKIPIGAISGAWRRTIQVALPILRHLWEGAKVPEDEQKAFVDKIMDIVLRFPQT